MAALNARFFIDSDEEEEEEEEEERVPSLKFFAEDWFITLM